MKLIFLSNYYTHHQKPVCEEWNRLTDGEFMFAATEVFAEERKNLGWESDTPRFLSEHGKQIASDIENADFVIFGSAPLDLVKERLKKGKTVFKCSERVFKKGYEPVKWLPRIFTYYRAYGRYKKLYLLSASAFSAADFAMHGVFRGKSYRWGYFPETKIYDTEKLLSEKDPARILWCGRFLDWKHPEAAVEVAKRLKADGIDFQLDFIGNGELSDMLQSEIDAHGLVDCVHLLGTMSPQQVRVHMEKAGIYLFTSDFNEGWGAVLNESMNSGCAVVASHAMGSTPFLVKHGENGLVYESGNTDDLYRKVKALILHPQKQKEFGRNAYRTITELWNAEVAAKRFMIFAKEIERKGSCDLFCEGPCSRAPIIKNNWFKEEDHDVSWIQDQMG